MRIPQEVLAQLPNWTVPPHPLLPGSYEFLGNAGGFSGSEFWRFRGPGGLFAVRRWPAEHPDRRHLIWIHELLRHCSRRRELLHLLPVPIPFVHGATVLKADGRFWELTAWLPGKADFHACPSAARLQAAMEVLARLHLALHSRTGPNQTVSIDPDVAKRQTQLHGLIESGFESLREAIQAGQDRQPVPIEPALALSILHEARQLAPLAAQRLSAVSELRVPLQPVLKDIWHDHVLFRGEHVTGIVDFGALAIGHISVDLARLLGSLCQCNEDFWRLGLDAYASVRPLASEDRELIAAHRRAGIVLGPVNWLTWLFVERRVFENIGTVQARLVETFGILRHQREQEGIRPRLVL